MVTGPRNKVITLDNPDGPNLFTRVFKIGGLFQGGVRKMIEEVTEIEMWERLYFPLLALKIGGVERAKEYRWPLEARNGLNRQSARIQAFCPLLAWDWTGPTNLMKGTDL